MSEMEQERIEQNIRRSAGIAALRKIRVLVDEAQGEDAARAKLLRAFWRYGWIAVLLALLVAWRLKGS